MPPTTRRSAASRTPRTPTQQQQTLNFRSAAKVTKPAVIHSDKHSKVHDEAAAPTTTDIAAPTGKEKHKHKSKSPAPAPEPTLEEALEAEKALCKEPPAEAKVKAEAETKAEPEAESDTTSSPLTTFLSTPILEIPLSLPSHPTFLQDLPLAITDTLPTITPTHLNTYLRTLLSARLTPPVHQNGLSTTEKILRYFDLSSQYGPCIGITRINRWKRAYRMGMDPPIEVLRCLVDVEAREGKPEKGSKGVGGGGVGGHRRDERTALVDEELSSRTAQE